MSVAESFTVVVPTYRRPGQLERCLRSLAALDYPRDSFEVIVVDDGSPVPPTEVVASVADDIGIRLVTQPNAGPAAARNHGASLAQGELLAFTDDDCAPAADWLTGMGARLAASRDAAIGGHTVNVLRTNPYATTSQLIVDLVYGYYNRAPGRAQFVTSNNLALDAEAFRSLGGFDHSFPVAAAEDRDFCARWLASGRRIVHAPEAVVSHAHALDLRGFLRQHFNYGRGAHRYHRAGAQAGRASLRRDLGFHLSLPREAAAAVRRTESPTRAQIAALLAVWQVANAAGYAWEWLRPD